MESGPAALTKKFFVFFLGIAVPLGSYFLSSGLVPFWKGGAKFGFLSLLVSSNIVFLPLVIIAVVAFFRTQIYPRREPARWEMVGLCLGTIISTFSLVAGFLNRGLSLVELPIDTITFPLQIITRYGVDAPMDLLQLALFPLFALFGIAPFYSPIWYGITTWRALKQQKKQATSSVAIAAFTSLPFMGASLLYAQKLYENLPDVAPRCYVVTATALTPSQFLQTICHPVTNRPVSRQLLTLKAFEYAWMQSNISSHSNFRLVYDVVGPALALLIRQSPLLAVFAYFSLKPAEFAALKYLEHIKNAPTLR